ncbi:MAG: high frequency lysogenization protein HflD [Gammaproteobacteria bacterium]|nr:high frequency lysogenization protein HflD [Gammaproteobacteria bacterium]
MNKLDNSVIALAGIAQAIGLVSEIAHTGKFNEVAFDASLQSILQTESTDVLSVYHGWDGIQYGLTKLIWLLTPPSKPAETRCMLSVMRLQKKIFRSNKMLNALTQRIQQAKKQANYFSPTHPTVISNLADAYETTLNALHFSTAIRGNPRIVNAHLNIEKIRALLLAGVRSTLLWRQLGGSKLMLIFCRTKIRNAAEQMLKNCQTVI